MRKILLLGSFLLPCLLPLPLFAQLPVTLDFENAAGWELNVAQGEPVNATATAGNVTASLNFTLMDVEDNRWVINAEYKGGEVNYLPCPDNCKYTPIPPVPDQPGAITNPNQNYLHVVSYISINSSPPILSANFYALMAFKRRCFARMKTDFSTTGHSGVTVSYWRVGGPGQSIYYSLDQGATWALLTVITGETTGWTRKEVTLAALDNQPAVRLGVLWDDNAGTVDATGLDEIVITGTKVAPTTPTIATTLGAATYCAGAALSVPFTVSRPLDAGNVFTAQLSDAAGSFATPLVIGTLAGTTAGTVPAQLPAGLAAGNKYRVRVVASSPVVTGNDNGNDLILTAPLSPPAVTAPATTFCAGQTVTLSVPGVPGASYQWKKDGQPTGSNQPSLVAGLPGTYTVSLTNACGTVAATNSLTLTAKTIPAVPRITAAGPTDFCTGGQVTLSIPPQENAAYRWLRDGVEAGTGQASFTANQAGVYRVAVSNDCGATLSENEVTVRVTLLPAAPTIAAAGPAAFCRGGRVQLSVPAQPGAAYQWQQDGTAVGGNEATLFATEGGVYSLTLTYPCGTVTAGNPVTVTVVDAPPPPQAVPAQRCGPGEVSPGATGGTAGNYRWYESPDAASPVAGAFTATLRRTVSATATFYVSIHNGSCESSRVPVTATVFPPPVADAGPDVQINWGEQVRLNASGGGTYAWFPATGLDNPAVAAPLAGPAESTTYTLTVTSADGCTATDEVRVEVLTQVSVPNAFTPNGDGYNDRWEITNLGAYPNSQLEVYNRWGARVYRSQGYRTPWDGTAAGQLLPFATYFYTIDLKDGSRPLRGSVSLVQ